MATVRTLIIDDDDISRQGMVDLLEGAAFTVLEGASPIGVTQRLISEAIDVLVLDVFMPELPGDKLARLLRGNPRLGSLGIVLVSSMDPERLKALAQDVDADAVVNKAEVHLNLCAAVLRAARRRVTPVSSVARPKPSPGSHR